MKFIHTADIHWGMVPDSSRPWSEKRAQAIKDTFRDIITLAKDREADCLFICGDLFHRQPLARDLKEINYLFSTIPATHVFIIAGNHDRVRPNSSLIDFSWAPNVAYFMEDEMQSVFLASLNTEVHGFSYHNSELRENRIDKVLAPKDGRIHILMAHGGDANHMPFDKKCLSENGFSYTALGHIHKPEIIAGQHVVMSGSPEPLDKTESGSHGVFYGEIDQDTGLVSVLEFIPTSKARYIPLIIHVTIGSTCEELRSRLKNECEKRGEDNIYRFKIRGQRDPDIHFDLDSLGEALQIVDIIDESEPQYDFSALFAEHSDDMIGFYIRALEKEEMTAVEKKALFYGIDALIHTSEERSS